MDMKALLVGLGLVGILSTGANAGAHPIIHHPGDADAYVIIHHHPVQIEYLACVGEKGVKWFEDGSPEYCTRIGQPGR
jgi:hypothetical protein